MSLVGRVKENPQLTAAVIIGFSLRAYSSFFQPVDPDEWYNVSMAIEPTVGQLFDRWYSGTASHPIGIYLLNYLQFKIAGDSVPVMRMLNAILGTLTIIIVHEISKALYSNRVATISAWSTSLFSVFLISSSSIRGYSVMIFLCTLSIYLAMKLLESGKLERRRLTIMLVSSMVMSSYTHYFGAMFSFLLYIFLVYKIYSKKNGFLEIIRLSAMLGVLILPLFIAILNFVQGGAGSMNDYIGQYVTFRFPYILVKNFLNGSNLLAIPFFLALFIRGIFWIQNEGKISELIVKNEILIFWLLAPLLFSSFISIIGPPIITPSNLSLSAPAISILIGKLVDDCLNEFDWFFPNLPYEKIFPILIISHLFLLYGITEHSRPDLEKPFEDSAQIVGDSDVVIVVNSDRFIVDSPDHDGCWSCGHFEGEIILIIDLPAESNLSTNGDYITEVFSSSGASSLVIMELSGWLPSYPDAFTSDIGENYSKIYDNIAKTSGSGVRTIVFEK